MDWVRDLLPSKVTEISEYFVYFGIFETHNWERRSSQDAKRLFLTVLNNYFWTQLPVARQFR